MCSTPAAGTTGKVRVPHHVFLSTALQWEKFWPLS
jgi:hypothetical protein